MMWPPCSGLASAGCHALLAASPWLTGNVVSAGLIGLGLLVALYVYAPFAIRHQQVKPLHDTYETVDPSRVAPELADVFATAAKVLHSFDFECLGYVTHASARTRQNSCVSVWTHPVTHDTAQVIGVLTPAPIESLRTVTLVAFRTEFTDLTAVVTANTPNTGCFPPDPRVSSIRCPGVHNLAFLYHLHTARVHRDRGRRVATLDRYPSASARLEMEHRDTFERLCDVGEYRLDAVRKQYVPTVKGAFLMTYRLLPPWKQMRQWDRARRRRRVLAELGFMGPDATALA